MATLVDSVGKWREKVEYAQMSHPFPRKTHPESLIHRSLEAIEKFMAGLFSGQVTLDKL